MKKRNSEMSKRVSQVVNYIKNDIQGNLQTDLDILLQFFIEHLTISKCVFMDMQKMS